LFEYFRNPLYKLRANFGLTGLQLIRSTCTIHVTRSQKANEKKPDRNPMIRNSVIVFFIFEVIE
jgi:hypothetical protein